MLFYVFTTLQVDVDASEKDMQGFIKIRVVQTTPRPPVNIDLQNGQVWDNENGVVLTYENGVFTAALYASGVTVRAHTYPRHCYDSQLQTSFPRFLFSNIVVHVPQSFSGRTRGLLGTLGGNITHDLFNRETLEAIGNPRNLDSATLLSEMSSCEFVWKLRSMVVYQ